LLAIFDFNQTKLRWEANEMEQKRFLLAGKNEFM